MLLELVQLAVGLMGLYFAYRVGYEAGRSDGHADARKWVNR